MHNNDAHGINEAESAATESERHNDEVEMLKARVAELEAALLELRERELRERAELENQRRRLHRDLEQARRFANERLLNDLLPVYDGVERGIAAEGGDAEAIREGLHLILKELLKFAESHGLTQVDPLGQPLDPEKHHAVSMIESAEHSPGHVVTVLQKGYTLNDRLLRPALVAVAKD